MAQQQISKKINAVLARIEGDDDDEQHAEAIKSMHKALMKIMTEAVAEAVAEAEAKAKAEAPAKAPAKVVTKSKSGSGGKQRPPTVSNNISSVVSRVRKGLAEFKSLGETVVTVSPNFGEKAETTRLRYEAYADQLPEGKEMTLSELISETFRLSKETNPDSGHNHVVCSCLVGAMLTKETRDNIAREFREIASE